MDGYKEGDGGEDTGTLSHGCTRKVSVRAGTVECSRCLIVIVFLKFVSVEIAAPH